MESMRDPLVSVIVPVFNTAKYLSKCIDSIIKQTYRNLEIILVDDGSTDGSSKILDLYKKRDARIKVIHKDNGGVSSARNVGIQEASGYYINFVDPDDWIPTKALESMVRRAQEHNADLVYGGLRIIGIAFASRPSISDSYIQVKQDVGGWIHFIEMHKGIPVAQLFKMDLITHNHIYFPESIKASEDNLFVLNYLEYCSIVVSISDTVYVYNCFQQTSATKKYYSEYNAWMLMCVETYARLLRGLNDNRAEAALSRKSQVFLHTMCSQCMRYMSGNREQKTRLFKEAYLMISPYLKEPEIGNFARTLALSDGAEQIYDQFLLNKQKSAFAKLSFLRKPVQRLKYFWYYQLDNS